MASKGTVLVTGGAGYIGSHTVRSLKAAGYSVVIFDNLSSGHREAVEGFVLEVGDLADVGCLEGLFKKYKFDAVVHFAGSIEAGLSVEKPDIFFQNNIVNGLNLINAMVKYNVKKIVFSSSAAVYGDAKKMPVSEEDEKKPTNPYGLTKLFFEQILASYEKAYGVRSISLRYFNAAGADPLGEIGPDHKDKSSLMEMLMMTAIGKNKFFEIYGTNYPTKDGTPVRDLIHVNDLADAHVLALEKINLGTIQCEAYNLGNGRGYTVREAIEMSKSISGKDFTVIEKKRRPGDIIISYADSNKARDELNWQPKYNSLEEIVGTAWRWHSSHPDGF